MKFTRVLVALLCVAVWCTILPLSVLAEENDGVPLPEFSEEILDEEGAVQRALDTAKTVDGLERLNVIASAVSTEQVVEIKAGSNADTINSVLKKAVEYSKQGRTLVVKFQKGTYHINKCLNVYSNTTLQAEGSTFVRTDTSKNLLRNVGSNGSTKQVGGYQLSQNIVIRGGTWDGGDVTNTTSKTNTMNFGHIENLYIQKATFKNNYGAHLVELSGVKNAQITDCKFSGHVVAGTSAKEAIQLDVAGYDSDGPWTSTYLADWTVCDTVLIKNCTVTGYPRAVGNHHYKSGYYNKNITVTNNTFQKLTAKNKDGTSVSHYAVYLFGFDNVTVTNNVISGCDTGVALHHATGINIKNNQISNTTGNGISIYSQSKVKEISGNTIKTVGKYGISINAASTAEKIKNNTISATQREAICISEKGTSITSIEGNSISKSGLGGAYNGIMVNNSAAAGAIKGNNIYATSKHGILISGATAKSITANKFRSCKQKSISYSGSKYAMDYKLSIQTIKSSGTKLKGTTLPNTAVWVTINSKKYKATSSSKGEFTITIPKQKKGTSLTVYAKGNNDNLVYGKKTVS